ncbi:MAG: hypothetical protein ABI862_06210, partial [Ilumatobacteraceae bacterium]
MPQRHDLPVTSPYGSGRVDVRTTTPAGTSTLTTNNRFREPALRDGRRFGRRKARDFFRFVLHPALGRTIVRAATSPPCRFAGRVPATSEPKDLHMDVATVHCLVEAIVAVDDDTVDRDILS